MTNTATLPEQTLRGKCTNCGEHSYRLDYNEPATHSDSGERDCPELLEVTVTFKFPAPALADGWANLQTEFGASIAATLHELIGDDGGAYSPVGVTVASVVPVAAAE